MAKPQQQADNSLEYQLKLLRLEMEHYQSTGNGLPHLVNRVHSVLKQAAALQAAREALEGMLEFYASDPSEVRRNRNNAKAAAARAALSLLNGEQP